METLLLGKICYCFRKLGDKKAISPLVALLSDFNAFVRKSVVTSLGMIGDESVIDF